MEPSSRNKELAQLLHTTLEHRQMYEIPFRGLMLYMFDGPTEPAACTYPLSFLWVAQGGKRITAQNSDFSVDQGLFLITQSEISVMSRVARASRHTPYLAFFLRLDVAVVRHVLSAARNFEPTSPTIVTGPAGVGVLTPELEDCCARILRLIANKKDTTFLQSLLTQEMVYLLLRSKQGLRLRHAAQGVLKLTQAEVAVGWLSRHYAAPLHIKNLAKRCGMGASTLYAHFKKLTVISPLQYQKQLRLRLQAARQRLRASGTDVTQTAYLVGYQSLSQFSREYKRFFGHPPARDALRNQKDAG